MDAYAVAETLDAAGIAPYKLDPLGGFFSSRKIYPTVVQEIVPNMPAPSAGDCLLSIFCDKGEVMLSFSGQGGDGEALMRGSVVNLFEGGLPLAGQSRPPFVVTTEPGARVWAVYEIYGRQWHKKLTQEGRDEWGVAVRLNAQQSFRVGGRLDPGHSINTLYSLYTESGRRTSVPLSL